MLINWQLWKKSHHDIINQIIMVSTVETYYLFSLSSHKRSLLSYRELNIDNNVFAEPRLHNSSSPGEPECKNILMGSSFYGAPPPPIRKGLKIPTKNGGGLSTHKVHTKFRAYCCVPDFWKKQNYHWKLIMKTFNR